MKKTLLIIVCASSYILSYSQENKKGFGSLTVQLPLKSSRNVGFGINVGRRPSKNFGIGVGLEAFGVKESDKKSSIYLPLYADVRYFFSGLRSIEPFFSIQPGYGFYNYIDQSTTYVRNGSTSTTVYSSIKGNGGFYFGTGIGLVGKGKLSPIVTLRYTTYSFGYTATGNYLTDAIAAKGNLSGLTINLGVAF